MFTFSPSQPQQFPRKHPNRIAPLPQIIQPDPISPLPPLPFYVQAMQPLPLSQSFNFKQKQQEKNMLQEQVQKYLQERNNIDQHYRKLIAEYQKLKKQYQNIKAQYRKGEQLYLELENQNMRLHNELQSLKKDKKLQKSRINVGLKKKEIPIVRINVPNPKTLANSQSQQQSIYRQLKSASEELAHMRKILQSEKQKSQHTQNIMSKNIEQATAERDLARNQILALKQDNRLYKDQISKLKSILSTSPQSINSIRNKDTSAQYDKLKQEYQRLQNVHRSCDILLSSKQTQIVSLKMEIDKLNQALKSKPHVPAAESLYVSSTPFSQPEFSPHRHSSNPLFEKFEKEQTTKQFNHFESSTKKYEPLTSFNFPREAQLPQVGLKQGKDVNQIVKSLTRQFMDKIDGLRNQLQWANKRSDHQKFELERVYQLLKDKKDELDRCYIDMQTYGKKSRSTPVKQDKQHDNQFLESLFKGPRNSSA